MGSFTAPTPSAGFTPGNRTVSDCGSERTGRFLSRFAVPGSGRAFAGIRAWRWGARVSL